ncbi:MAG TPA: hypothetical protein PLA74_09225 [Syntrophales bacterium]|nr:hypothetical protein [Syntrophales bacterium]HPQ45405.1 hypothetical protein [Syntrophales bacterium]
MSAAINKKGNADDILREEALWEDPMCYPAYDTASLLDRHSSENKKDAKSGDACRVAA